MTARVYCFVSAKGGAGKTSLAANFAKLVCAIGRKCLVIDCDPATHGMTLLYLHEVSENSNPHVIGLFELFEGEGLFDALHGSVVNVESGVHLLPATYRFHTPTDQNRLSKEQLAMVIAELKSAYDVIFLDAQAGCDACARMAMSASISDEVVIVSEYDPLSAAGIEMMKRVVGEDLGYARTWILVNKILPEFVSDFGEFTSITKYLPPIPWDADVVRSYAQRKLALDLQKGNEYTLAIIQSARRLMNPVCGKDISSWISERAYELRAPLEEQRELANEKLSFLVRERERLRRRRQMRSVMIAGGLAYSILAAGVILLYYSPLFFEVTQTAVSIFVVAAVLGFTAMVMGSRRSASNSQNAEDSQFAKQIEQLKERVSRLDVIRDADDETIFREYDLVQSHEEDQDDTHPGINDPD